MQDRIVGRHISQDQVGSAGELNEAVYSATALSLGKRQLLLAVREDDCDLPDTLHRSPKTVSIAGITGHKFDAGSGECRGLRRVAYQGSDGQATRCQFTRRMASRTTGCSSDQYHLPPKSNCCIIERARDTTEPGLSP